MRALTVREFGTPEVLTVAELPVPDPQAGEVRIRVRAAGANPVDVFTRSGAAYPVFPADPPFVIGWELAGEIDAVGDGVLGWQPGDRVVALSTWYDLRPGQGAGVQAEYAVVPAAATAPAPSTVDPVAAATLPLNGLTAEQAVAAARLDNTSTLAVTGAAGAVGGFAVQLAAARGVRVVALAAAEDEPLLRRLGADVVVARSADPAEAIRRAVPGGVDAVVDAAVLGDDVSGAIRDGGTLVVLSGLADPKPGRGVHVDSISVRADGAALARLSAAVDQGGLSLRVADAVPVADAVAVHQRLEKGGLRGRLVLTFD